MLPIFILEKIFAFLTIKGYNYSNVFLFYSQEQRVLKGVWVFVMRKRILAYIEYMNRRLESLEKEYKSDKENKDIDDELEKLKKEHLTQIAFFQHERLIHLIVTVLFAVLEFLSLFMCMLIPNIGTFLLTTAVLVLLVPYIRHYYLLENEVQRMYEQYDRLQNMIGKDSFRLQ